LIVLILGTSNSE